MRLQRRTLLAAGALAATAPAALAQGADPRMAERGIGKPDAPVKVLEFFSLSCGHCAAFHRDTLPQVKKDLVDSGAVRLVWRDFPLEPRAMAAALVARSLPPERYEGFIGVLLANQDRWAFTRSDPLEELAKFAALAGMARTQFDKAVHDDALYRAIVAEKEEAEKEFEVRATPSFSFRGRRSVNQSGNMPFERFAQFVQEVKPA